MATAATGVEAVEQFTRHKPDVTLMDLMMPESSGLDAIRAIKHADPAAKIIVLTAYRGDEDIHRALDAGATTYLLKNTLSNDLVRVVREVYAGGRPIPSDVAAQLAGRVTGTTLSAREIGVLELIAAGMRNKEVAAVLGITEDTVEGHVKRIFFKLRVNDRTAAVTAALRRGIIHVD